MTKLTKYLLVVAGIGLITGGLVDFCVFDPNPLFTALLPLGAVFLALSVISLLLEQVMAEFDREETERMRLVQTHQSQPQPGLGFGPAANPSRILQAR